MTEKTRKRRERTEIRRAIELLHAGGMTPTQISRITKASRPTVYSVIGPEKSVNHADTALDTFQSGDEHAKV